MKLMFTVAAILGIVLCGLAAVYIFRKLFFGGQKEETGAQRETKLWSQEGTIQLFKDEPKVHQLVDKSASGLPAKITTVPSDSEVTVIEESDIALRIKIKSGEHKGSIGWVDKAYVMGYSQK